VRPYRSTGVEHRSCGCVRVDEPEAAVDEQNRISAGVQRELGSSELIRGPFPIEPDAERPAEMAGEAESVAGGLRMSGF